MSVDSHLYRAHGDDLLSSNDASRRPTPRRPLARMAFRHPGLAIAILKSRYLSRPPHCVPVLVGRKVMLPELPEIFIPAFEKRRLTAAADAASLQHLSFAPFLRAELRRARTCSSAELPPDIVTMNGWVSYQIDWRPPSEPCRIVYPQAYTGANNEISLMSPLGVALLGLRVGDRMPFFSDDRQFRIVSAVSVDPPVSGHRPGQHTRWARAA